MNTNKKAAPQSSPLPWTSRPMGALSVNPNQKLYGVGPLVDGAVWFAAEQLSEEDAALIVRRVNQGPAFDAMVVAIYDEEEKVEKARDFLLNIKCSCSGDGVGTPGGCDRCRALDYLSTVGWDLRAALKLAQEVR